MASVTIVFVVGLFLVLAIIALVQNTKMGKGDDDGGSDEEKQNDIL